MVAPMLGLVAALLTRMSSAPSCSTQAATHAAACSGSPALAANVATSRARSGLADRGGGGVEPFLLAGREHHRRARVGERRRDRPPDALRRAGDERDLAGEFSTHERQSRGDDGRMAGVAVPDRVAPEHATARLGYIPALDGLRALAVIAVLLYHADQAWIPGGFLGVDVFFVISGYLITCLLLSDWQQTNGIGLKRFWYRRARRLLPALFAMLFVVSLYAILFLPDVLDQLRGEVDRRAALRRELVPHLPRPVVLPERGPSAAAAARVVAGGGGAVLPVLAADPDARADGVGQEPTALLIGVLAGVAISTIEMAILYHPYTDPSRVYYGTDTRVAALLLGSALAFVWAPWRLIGAPVATRASCSTSSPCSAASCSSGCSSTSASSTPSLYRGGFLVAAMVSAVLIAATVHPASRLVPWLLGFAVFRWIGVRSYGIYLWHWPIYMVTRPHSDVPLTGLPLLVLRLTLTFAAAALSYKYIEEPIRHGAIERQWAQLPRRHRRDPSQADDPVHARGGRDHRRTGDHRRRARQRGQREHARRVRESDAWSSCARRRDHHHRRRRQPAPSTTAPANPDARGAADGHRHRRLGDARRATAAAVRPSTRCSVPR